MLDLLQSPESQTNLWGGDKPKGSVVACDFYNAGALLSLPDDEIVRTLVEKLLPKSQPRFLQDETP